MVFYDHRQLNRTAEEEIVRCCQTLDDWVEAIVQRQIQFYIFHLPPG